nr:unnamed protein product [Callosobruchus analis]
MKTGEAVFSCTMKDEQERVLTRYYINSVSDNITELQLFFDNCPGQNKNHVDSTQILDFRNWRHRYFKKSAISVETSAKPVPRDARERFNISKFHYFLFTSANGRGVIAAKDYIGGLMTHTFPLLLPGVVTVDFPNESAIPNGRIPITDKKMVLIKKAYSFVDENLEAQSFWRKILKWPTFVQDSLE